MAIVALQKLRRFQLELIKAKCKIGLPTKTTEAFSVNLAATAKTAGPTTDNLAKSVDPERIGQIIDSGPKIARWASTEVWEHLRRE